MTFSVIFLFYFFLNKLWEILQKRDTLEGIRVVLAGGGRHQTIHFYHIFHLIFLKETVEIGYRFFIFLPAEESQKKLINNTTKFDTKQIHTFGAPLLPLSKCRQSILFLHFCL